MPDSLLSRFDLLFVVLDKTDDEFNRAIAEHVSRLHRYTPEGVQVGTPLTEEMVRNLNATKVKATAVETVFEDFNELLHIGLKPTRRKKNVEILSMQFLKKYLHYAKARVSPVLTEESSEYIAQCYAELRNQKDGVDGQYRTMPITPRTLETLIRLSTAHAKTRLSPLVEEVDAEVAFEILSFALFKKVVAKKNKKKQKVAKEGDESEDSNLSDNEGTVRTFATQTAVSKAASTGNFNLSKAAPSMQPSSVVTQLIPDSVATSSNTQSNTNSATPVQQGASR